MKINETVAKAQISWRLFSRDFKTQLNAVSCRWQQESVSTKTRCYYCQTTGVIVYEIKNMLTMYSSDRHHWTMTGLQTELTDKKENRKSHYLAFLKIFAGSFLAMYLFFPVSIISDFER